MPLSAKFPALETTLTALAGGLCLASGFGPPVLLPAAVQPLALAAAGAWGLRRTLALDHALARWWRWHHGPSWRVTVDVLSHVEGCLLGKAFRLEARHTQLLEDILRTDGALPLDRGPRGGYPLLHAVGEAEEVDQVLSDAELGRHTLITGTPGSGKTRALAMIASSLMQRPGAVVMIDPKGDRELMLHCAAEAKRHGKPWAVLTPAFPQLSATMNVLDTCRTPAEVAMRVHALMPSAGGRSNEPFFEQYALALIERIADIQQRLGQQHGHPVGNPWTLADLYRPAVLRLDLLMLVDTYLEAIGIPNTPFKGRKGSRFDHRFAHYRATGLRDMTIDALLDDLEKPRDHFTKVTATLIPTFRGVVGEPLERLLSTVPADLTWTRIAEDGMVVYVALASMLLGDDANRIGRVILQDLIGFLGQRYAYADAAQASPITVLVDELYEVLYPQFTTALAMSRGARCRWILAQQSLAHTAAKLGRDTARVLLDNCTTRLYFQLADKETAEDVSESLGTCTIDVPARRPDVTNAYGGSGGLAGAARKGFKAERVPLIRPEWLYALPIGEYVGRIQGVPVKGRIPLLTLPDEAARTQLGLHDPWQALNPAAPRLLPMPTTEEIAP